MELLQLTRAGNCEQSGNGALALGTPIAEHDLPPLHGRPEGSFGHVVGGCDRLFMHEGEEVGVMHGATRQGWSKGSDDAVIHETSFVVQRVRNPSGEGSARPHR